MKICIRTLKQENYEFILDENDTIDTLKTLINEKLGHEKTWQNLIFSGTMLEGTRTIASYKITEKDFLVLLIKKPREAPAPAAAAPAPAPTPAPAAAPVAAPEAPKVEAPKPAEQKPTQPATPTQAQQPSGGQGGAFGAAPAEVEAMIRAVMEMGFDRTQVERALQASYFNADRAVELLMMGIPIPDMQELEMHGDEDMDEDLDEEMDEEYDAADPQQLFDALRASPQLQQLRLLAQTNPSALEQVLSQLPEPLLNVISNNQEDFLRLLSEGPVAGGAGAGGQAPQHAAFPPQQQGRTVSLSPEDQAVITNLVDMGFDKQRVTEAYILFEKDADMTANYLLNHGWDELPPQRFNGQ
eukprot:TRINITY_DN10433_c0_g1_i1.p1 TRINITY_DN10433_c0_g1~~TRINITY_DN10433_c0_g1_i1.p1  ORF type:complete len:356 (-),score=115.29 TRINITY_DN10433_c0_g1_i1:43-1110(-)